MHSDIQLFRNNNTSFFDYFSEKRNKDHFIETISEIVGSSKKIEVRDYYLSLLHKIGEIGFYNNSFFVSTTSDYRTAVNFSENRNDSEGIIIVSWINFPLRKSGITFNYLNKSKELIEFKGLPTYNASFFPKQKEISIKGGLLPHYILGYIKLRRNEFVINPNLFSDLREFKEIVKSGIEINQSSFHNALNETDYSGFIFINEDGNMYDIN